MQRTTKYAVGLIAIISLLCGVLLIRGSVQQVPSGNWAPAGNMASARAGAATVALQDGRLLITGGDSGAGALAATDLFDTSGSFATAAPMNFPRAKHTATLLADGRVLVAGGVSRGTASAAAEIYDPMANTWTATGPLMTARSGHSATLLADGTVLIAGGDSSGVPLSSLEVFNPASRTFTPTAATLSSPKEGHAAAVLQDGRVLFVGGFDGTNPLATSDIYDPKAGTVSAGPLLSTPRQGLSATTQLDGRVFVAGGNNGSVDLASAEVFDPATTAFTVATSGLATARKGHQAFLLPHNGNVLIVGGTSGGAALASAELYIPWTGNFSTTGSMVSARANATGNSLAQDGLLVVAGGKDTSGNTLQSSELYGFAWVKTDKADYAPGTTVTITGGGWQPNERVTLHFQEQPALDTHPDLIAVADASGNISNSQFSPDEHDAYILFYLTATGAGSQAQMTFTDSPAPVVSCSPNPVATNTASTCTATENKNQANDNMSWSSSGSGTFNPTSCKLDSTAGQCSVSYTPSSTGTQTITATDTTGGSAGTFSLSVFGAATKLVFSVQPSSAQAGSSITPAVQLQVQDASGNVVSNSTASITMAIGTNPSGGALSGANPVSAVNGIATFSTLSINNTASGYTLTAASGTLNQAISNTFNVTGTTATAVQSSVNPSVFGQLVTFTATVSPVPAASGTPTGTVTFKDGGTTITGCSAVPLNGSLQATCTPSSLASTSHSITAVYNADANYTGSTSSALTQTVNKALTTTTVNPSANPSVFGQSVTFTATSIVTLPGTGTPTGTVTFKDGATTLGTGALNGSGVATFSTSALSLARTRSPRSIVVT